MEACEMQQLYTSLANDEQADDVTRWLCVSGDIDDLIYFGEETGHSQR